jgi:adenosylcobinamide-GDP ribazoletransferase
MSCAGYLLLAAALLSEASIADAPMLGFVFVISRALSAWAMAVFQSARPKGMLDAFAQAAHRRMVTISSGLYVVGCAVCWFAFGGWLGAVCVATAALCLLCYKRMAYKHFGGVTGDLAGFFLQIAELALVAAIILGGKL